MRATHLWVAPYNDYQNFLCETILRLRNDGLNFQEIANWMNTKGYLTPRGKTFGNAHAHSILKKKKIRDVRLTTRYEPELSDFSLRFIDKTIVNQ